MPRPGWLLLTNSTLFIGLSLFAAGYVLSNIGDGIWYSDHILIVAVICLIMFAWWQYRGFFLSDTRAAQKLFWTLILLLFSLILPFYAEYRYLEGDLEFMSFGWRLPLIGIDVALLAWVGASILLTKKWWNKLILFTHPEPAKRSKIIIALRTRDWRPLIPAQFSLYQMLGLITALAVLVAGYASGRRMIGP